LYRQVMSQEAYDSDLNLTYWWDQKVIKSGRKKQKQDCMGMHVCEGVNITNTHTWYW
jgi:hypothetical protein